MAFYLDIGSSIDRAIMDSSKEVCDTNILDLLQEEVSDIKKCDNENCGEPVSVNETICKDCVERCYCGAECETEIKGDKVCWDCFNIFKKHSMKLYNMAVEAMWHCPCNCDDCEGGCGTLHCGCIDVCRGSCATGVRGSHW